jgi:hypothetical protein
LQVRSRRSRQAGAFFTGSKKLEKMSRSPKKSLTTGILTGKIKAADRLSKARQVLDIESTGLLQQSRRFFAAVDVQFAVFSNRVREGRS